MTKPTAPAAAKTLKAVHANIKELHKGYREKVMLALGFTDVSSFYDVLAGTRKLNPSEKEAVAAIYGLSADAIDWQDEKNLPE